MFFNIEFLGEFFLNYSVVGKMVSNVGDNYYNNQYQGEFPFERK